MKNGRKFRPETLDKILRVSHNKNMKLKLKVGGILERYDWDSEKQTYEPTDVSDRAFRYLNEPIELDDTTVKDLFLLIHKNMDMFFPIFGNWIDEFTHNALNNESSGLLNDVEYVQLYWSLVADEDGLHIPAYPEFEGIGTATDKHQGYEIGDTINWGMSFTPVEDFVHLPLKLKNTVDFRVENPDNTYETRIFKVDSYTLYQVIQGFIWEMSFYGGPDQAKELHQNLNDQIARIKSGEEKTYTFEEWDEIENNESAENSED